ncbi:outer membrane beta-barrel protein [Ferruginibacter sp.]
MSNNGLFDDNIKDQFSDYTPSVHPRIWENIVAERKKRRPAGFWFTFFNGRNILLLTALLIAGASGAYLLSKKAAVKQQDSVAITAEEKTVTGTTAANEANEKIKSNTEVINNTDDQNIISPKNNNTDDEVINSKNNTATVTTSSSFSKIKISSPLAQPAEKYFTSKSKKNKTAFANSEYDISDADLSYNDKPLEDFYLQRLQFANLQKAASEKNLLSLKKRLLPNVFLPDCPSIEKDAAGNKTYIEIYAGPDIAFRNISDTGNSAYLQKRKESTKFSSAYSAGLRYTKVFNNGMSVRTGVNYSQINEKFTFVQGNLVQITYIIDANGDTTGSYITTGTRYKTTYNKFKTIDVPLLVGYEMGNGKFHANINAGVIVNIYSWQKGEVLDASYQPVNITTGKTSSPYQYKTNIGMGFMAAASFYYKLNEKLHVLAEPYFRYSLSPMSKENLTFKQKYNTAGLRVGLRLDLR